MLLFGGKGVVDGGLRNQLIDYIVPSVAMLNHTIDGAPVGEATQVAIVDKNVGFEFAREMGIIIGGFFGVVAINGIELEATLATIFYSLIEQMALTNRPQNDTMTILAQHLQGIDGERNLLAYLRVLMGYNCTVEIYCDQHKSEE